VGGRERGDQTPDVPWVTGCLLGLQLGPPRRFTSAGQSSRECCSACPTASAHWLRRATRSIGCC
jgi:hypothetical protein